jgi:hypothetical protein
VTDVRRYRLRRAPIIHDTIDNETIAINQLTGAYYSLEGASAFAWQRLADGASAADIADALAQTYDGEQASIAEAAQAFVAELLDEQLIVADTDTGADADRVVQSRTYARTGRPFSGLRLQRYTDLEVMLLADPIHEVDATGWPMPLAESKE